MKKITLLGVGLGLLPLLGWAQLPTLQQSSPARNSPAGSRSGPITLSFSGPVADPARIRVATTQLPRQGAGTFSGAGTRQLSFLPAQAFAPGESVSVTVPASVSSPAQVVEFLAAAGRGTATFSAPLTISTPPSVLPKIVVAGDLDRDGDLDLVVGEFATTHVCLNDGTGQFTTQAAPVSAAPQPVDLHLADFNNDGRLDLLSSGTFGNGVWLSLGTGQGTFAPGTQLLPTAYSAQLITGDFNADGYPDAVVTEAAGTGALLSFLPGSADGLRAPAYTRPVVLSVQDVGAADMNEDGALDLLVVAGSTLGVYLNDGTGQFTAGVTRTINPICFELAVGDFTGDGHADVLCSSYQGANISLVPGTGTGGLGALQNVAVLSRTYHVNFGDMDGDGDLDLLINIDRGIVQVLLNDGRGQFAAATSVLIGLEPFSMAAAADLNGDGALDIYTGNDTSNPGMPHGIDVFFNHLPLVTATRPASSRLVLEAFPNPAHEQVTLRLPVGNEPVAVELRDVLGRLVRALPAQLPAGNGEVTLSLVGLPSGVYLLRALGSTYQGACQLAVN